MQSLPPVELPEQNADDCRALMVVIPVLTDPSQWQRRKRRPSLMPVVVKACVLPVCLALVTLAVVWLTTNGNDMMPAPIRQSFQQLVASVDTTESEGKHSASSTDRDVPRD